MGRSAFLVVAALIAGIAIGSGIQSRWNYSVISQLDASSTATLIAGFGGALVGGLISLVLALISIYVTLRRDKESRLEEEQTLVLEVVSTQIQLSGRCYTLYKTVDEAVESHPDQPWTALRPSALGDSPTPRFNARSFSPFIKAGAGELVHECLLYADRVDSLYAMFDHYNTKRMEWEAMAEANTVIGEDGVGKTEFKGEDAKVAHVRAYVLNDLVTQMHRLGKEWTEEGAQLTDKVNKAQKKYFGSSSRFNLQVDYPTANGRDEAPA